MNIRKFVNDRRKKRTTEILSIGSRMHVVLIAALLLIGIIGQNVPCLVICTVLSGCTLYGEGR